jgi:hypothetical protein
MPLENCLTCDFAEELQQAAESGTPTDSFVNALESATLPGLMEYGCAKWHCNSLPPLPSAITDSTLGQALHEVRSELGLRSSGAQKHPPRTVTALSNEFIVLEGDGPTVHRDWKEFLVRVRQSATGSGFSIGKAKGIAASLGEMADNATLHSNAPVGILVGYQATAGAVVCCVADVGDGILHSLRSHEAYRDIQTHKQAIRKAMEKGQTRYGPGKGGFGFYRVFKSLTAMWGTLRFRSGEGCVTMDGNDFEADQGKDAYVLNRAGFQVTICCRLSETGSSNPLI